MKQIIGLLTLVVAFGTVSCFKKGCRDIDATNYDPKAKRNGNNCTYYTKMKVSEVKVLNYSNVNTSGLSWDSADDADIFVRLLDWNNNIMFQSDFIENNSGEASFTISPAITITDLTSVKFQMRDYDNGYQDSYSEKMIETYFPISEYTSQGSPVVKEETGNYPDFIEVSEAGATIQIMVSWE